MLDREAETAILNQVIGASINSDYSCTLTHRDGAISVITIEQHVAQAGVGLVVGQRVRCRVIPAERRQEHVDG